MNTLATTEPTSRERVLLAARQLIIDHGLIDFSMRELAAASGLAKATIYHHFPDKQTICLSVVEIEIAALRDRIEVAAQSADDPEECLRSVISELLGPQLELRLPVILAAREIPVFGLQFHDIIIKYRSELVAPIADIIQDGIQKGVFRSVDVNMTVISLMGMMQSYVTYRLIVSPDQQLESIAEHTADLLLHGIAKSP